MKRILNYFLLFLFLSNIKIIFCLLSPPDGKPGDSSTNDYDYSTINYVIKDEDLNGGEYTSSTSDQSVLYVESTTEIKVYNNSKLTKSGDTAQSSIENCEFYGVNAAVLVNGGKLAISDSTISTSGKGANAIVATNSASITISKSTITSTSSQSGRGLHSTYGGKITATEVTVSSTGGSCANLATDRGEGTVSCSKCTLTTGGAGSPLIYSTGDITVSDGTTGTSKGAQMVVVEGKNSATVIDSELKCIGKGNRDSQADKCGVMLYQSMSGDAASGTTSFTCTNSKMQILEGDYYSSAPMFFVTDTTAKITLTGCTFTYGSGIFLSAAGNSEGWGTSGSNGGDVTLKLVNQDIEGDLNIDGVSTLTFIMEKSTIKGSINHDKTAKSVNITLDANSKIILTKNSYYTSLTNGDSTGSNIDSSKGTFESYNSNTETTVPTTDTSKVTNEISCLKASYYMLILFLVLLL